MDKIIKTTLGLFIVLLVAFVAVTAYTSYIDTAYRNSLTSQYTYSFTLSTDAVLTNVTLFVPVPEDTKSNSPVIETIGSGAVTGVPTGWKTALFGTGKSTLLKIWAPQIGETSANGAPVNTTITFAATANSPTAIDTLNPVANASVFRPVQKLNTIVCTGNDGSTVCSSYQTSIYASYSADPSATVTIHSTVIGTNTWTIFKTEANAYKNQISVGIQGPNKGWVTAEGWIGAGEGTYTTS
ncbi:MAG: hypothetical protein WC342_04480 [Methanoregula sp.]|jgi:hypothetical protein